MAATTFAYSEVHDASSGVLRASPDGKLLAGAEAYRIIIRDLDTLQTVQIYSCLDQIEHIEWSADSKYVLCALFKRGLVQVWSVDAPEWHCKIDEGPLGLAWARWAPGARHVVASSDFSIRLTIWSLVDRSVFFIKCPKFPRAGIDFSRVPPPRPQPPAPTRPPYRARRLCSAAGSWR